MLFLLSLKQPIKKNHWLMKNMSPSEIKNKKKARKISFTIHAILLLLALLITIDGLPKEIEPMYEVQVNFSMEPSSNSTKSRSKSGKERAKVKDVTEIEQHKAKTVEVEIPKPKVEEVKVIKANPTPTDPIVSEVIDEEETDVVAVEEEVDIEDPEEDVVPDPEPDPAPEVEVVKSENSSSKTPNTSGGKSETGSDSKDASASNNKDGKGTGKGNKGTGKGSDSSGDDNDSGKGKGGIGSGEYDGSGDGVFGRKVVYVNRNYNFELKGTMAIKICINRYGNVLSCSIIEDETSVNDRSILKKVLKLVKGYKFERDMSAPKEQCGKTKIVVDDKRNGDGNTGQGFRFW